jgi:hypothetical protein
MTTEYKTPPWEEHEKEATESERLAGLRGGMLLLLHDTYGVPDQFGHVQPIEDVIAVLFDVRYCLQEAGSWEKLTQN